MRASVSASMAAFPKSSTSSTSLQTRKKKPTTRTFQQTRARLQLAIYAAFFGRISVNLLKMISECFEVKSVIPQS